MRKLVLLSTGGTIATTFGPHGLEVKVGAEELLDSTRTLRGGGSIRVESHEIHRIVSSAASVSDILALARAIRMASREADGVVVTHGTDSMEESAFLTALTHESAVPVAFTGAQRPFDDPAPDGPANLSAALSWLGDPRSDGTGVSIVFDGEVIPAVGAQKVHTKALNAFQAPGRAPIAAIDDSGMRVFATPPKVPVVLSSSIEPPRVDVVGQYLGADATALHASVAAGARGLVVAGFGVGNTTPETTEACLDLLGSGFPIALSSRVAAGPVHGVYADSGAELVRAGAIPMGDLPPGQARLLLAAILTHSSGDEEISTRCREWLTAVGAAS